MPDWEGFDSAVQVNFKLIALHYNSRGWSTSTRRAVHACKSIPPVCDASHPLDLFIFISTATQQLAFPTEETLPSRVRPDSVFRRAGFHLNITQAHYVRSESRDDDAGSNTTP